MTVPLTTAAQTGIFDRLGSVFAFLSDILALKGGAPTARVLTGASAVARGTALDAIYSSGINSVPLGSTFDGFLTNTLPAFWAAQQGTFAACQRLCQSTIVNQVNADTPLLASNAPTALATLIQQMTNAGTSVNASAPAVGTLTPVGSPNGTLSAVVSVRNVAGALLQYCFAENLTFTATRDSQTGGAALGNEQFSVSGQALVGDTFSHLWPGGSGCSASRLCVDGSRDYPATGNLLRNSDFQVFTNANVPDNWVVAAGVAGTQVFNGGAGNAYTLNGGSLQFTGDVAGTNTAVYQQFATAPTTAVGAGGTAAVLLPSTPYAVNLWLKCSAAPAAGVVAVDLTDGTGAIVNDNSAAPNTLTQSLTAVGNSFVVVRGSFRTPAVLPAQLRLRLRLSTAIDAGKSVYFGRLGMAAMGTPLYAGGPYATLFSGSSKIIAGLTPDAWVRPVTMVYGQVQMWMERVIGMRAAGLQIPSSATPTCPDTVIS
jgi:hypothetical protein